MHNADGKNDDCRFGSNDFNKLVYGLNFFPRNDGHRAIT